MRTTQTDSASVLHRDEARYLALQAMLHEHQREMRALLQRRLLQAGQVGPDDGGDDSERAEAGIQEHIEAVLTEVRGDTLQRLREALVRLGTGDYGNCADCGLEISEQRLQALPFALRCTACEARHEGNLAHERRLRMRLGSPFVFAP